MFPLFHVNSQYSPSAIKLYSGSISEAHCVIIGFRRQLCERCVNGKIFNSNKVSSFCALSWINTFWILLISLQVAVFLQEMESFDGVSICGFMSLNKPALLTVGWKVTCFKHFKQLLNNSKLKVYAIFVIPSLVSHFISSYIRVKKLTKFITYQYFHNMLKINCVFL